MAILGLALFYKSQAYTVAPVEPFYAKIKLANSQTYKLGKLMTLNFERGIPLVAASFTDIPVNMDVIKSQGLDIAEIRVDQCKNQDALAIYEVLRAFQVVGIKTMLTIRSWNHGGRWTRSHAERIELILRVFDVADIIDIEDDCEVPNELRDILYYDPQSDPNPPRRATPRSGPLLLVSHHNTKFTPTHSELCTIRDRALEKKPDLIKIATHVQRSADLQRLNDFLSVYGGNQKLILIGMGREGKMSRVFFGHLGSPITFCYREAPPAPRQLPLHDMVSFLRTFYPRYDEAMNKRLQEITFS